MRAARLTQFSRGGGCACKLPPDEVHSLVAAIASASTEPVLVGNETADDGAVYRLSAEQALVTTADFFTPVVDDPFDFGRIAAANALSDVYAMGGAPLTALNLVAWPFETLGREALRKVLDGAASIADEAGVAVVGGHSIDDPEPKFGWALTGLVHPEAILRNSTARLGDDLFLTKPLGTGVVTTELKRGLADPELVQAAVDVMSTLNRDAAQVVSGLDTSAVTDVTGFGLLGHLHELTLASGLAARIEATAVPLLDGAIELAAVSAASISGGTKRNRQWLEGAVTWGTHVDEARRWLLCDATTSGGLLVASSAGAAVPGAWIGTVEPGTPGSICVD